MKNTIRNVVVEYKNKRARKTGTSLWGSLDLKSIAREVEADASQSMSEVKLTPDLPEQAASKVEIKAVKPVPVAEPVFVNIAESPLITTSSDAEVSQLETTPGETVAPRMPELMEAVVVTAKKPSIRSGVRKVVPRKQSFQDQLVAEADIQAELLSLEIENVNLKRELMAKLRAEKILLHAIARRLKQRGNALCLSIIPTMKPSWAWRREPRRRPCFAGVNRSARVLAIQVRAVEPPTPNRAAAERSDVPSHDTAKTRLRRSSLKARVALPWTKSSMGQ